MFWALGRTVGDAFYVSGSSLLTLGFAPVDTLGERILAFSEATLGLGIVALVITFLPSIYAAFSRRESQVALLETRAGSPPTAIEFLIRYQWLDWLDQMPAFWERWEIWFAGVQESHTSFAALNFFRSPQPDQSWIVAACTVLDASWSWRRMHRGLQIARRRITSNRKSGSGVLPVVERGSRVRRER